MDNLTPALIWGILGLVCIVIEAVTAHFVLIFFGLSALLVALIKIFGLSHFNIELIIFTIGGVAGVALFRKKLLERFKASTIGADLDRNKEIHLSTTLLSGQEAKIEYQGTLWTAVNPTNQDMLKGSKVVIEKTESTKLILKHHL